MEKTILVINPNTSEEMAKSIDASAKSIASGFNIITRVAEFGPETIEGPVDRALCVPGMIATAINEKNEFHAIVSACFADPGIEALQSLFDLPVLGIADSSFFLASRIAAQFSILALQQTSVPFLTKLVKEKGYAQHLFMIKGAGVTALETEGQHEEVAEKILITAKRLVEEGSQILVMACAGLGPYAELIFSETGIPCIDPVKAGVQMAGIATQYMHRTKGSLSHGPYDKKLMGYHSLRKLYNKTQNAS